MSDTKRKIEILKNEDYKYNFRREIYYKPQTKKVFSREAIEDHNPEWLYEKIHEDKNNDEWYFYLNDSDSVSEKIKNSVIKELEG